MRINPLINYNNVVYFKGNKKDKNGLPEIKYPTKESLDPLELPGVSKPLAIEIINSANKLKLSVDDYLREYLKQLFWQPRVQPEASITRQVGKTNVTTLIDGGQIFEKTLELVQKAQKSIQIEMFEFQNLKIDGHIWPSRGAEVVPGFEQQQKLLKTLIKKKKENPDIKIQVILDAHKWYIDGFGYKKHYNNMNMIKYLKENGIDVVPYPRAAQQGATLQHVKLVAVDGKHLIIGGMNWGTHSVANHDACVAVETLPNEKHSEVDNIIAEIFNKDWKFAWQRLGATKLVSGPLNKEEQKDYNGIRQDIKEENVEYMEVVGTIYDNPNDLNRYAKKRLDLIEVEPIENPAIRVLATKPRELSIVKEQGEESTREYLKEKVKTVKKLRAELFVFSDKELIETIIKRYKEGSLDVKFIVASEILEEFPYCRRAYSNLVKNGVPVRLYNFDERVNQRMHSKWAVFDDTELLIGSTNWSAQGLNANLKKGQRGDYEMHTAKINAQIRGYLKEAVVYEKELGIKQFHDPRKDADLDYEKLKIRRDALRKCYAELSKTGSGKLELDGKTLTFDDSKKATLARVIDYYDLVKKRNNDKEKYKRGNNECAIAFVQKDIANVFTTQFEKDWIHSKNSLEELNDNYNSHYAYEDAPSTLEEA